jgi:hypothetical protein
MTGKKHLMIMVHGINGHASDLNFFQTELHNLFGNPDNLIIVSTDIHTKHTNAGIDFCGLLVAEYIKKQIQEHQPSVLSVLGHSMGGLTLRYALGALEADSENILEDVDLGCYISLATPHLSSIAWHRMLPSILSEKALNYNIPHLLMGPTGKQLFLQDVGLFNDTCLIVRMATEEKFLKPLGRFQTRICYSNLDYDLSVHFGTSIVLRRNPIDKGSLVWDSNPELYAVSSEKDNEKPHGLEIVEKMVLGLQTFDWERVAIKPTRWLLAHTDIVTAPRPESKIIVQDIFEKIKHVI